MIVCEEAGQASRTCRKCGASFVANSGPGAPRKYCHECRHGPRPPRSRPAPKSAEEKKEAKRRSDKERYERAVGGWDRKCHHCGSLMEGRRRDFCDKWCRSRHKHPSTWFEGPCPECGKQFKATSGYQKFCSRVCSKRKGDRVRCARRRARATGAEKVNPVVVFARDKWRCQLCGVRTPWRLRGTMDPRAPELDHIVPTAVGGEHSYRNTQLACKACNIRKASKPLGQLRLFG